MGALVFGYPHEETIIVSHSSIYMPLGEPKQPIDQYSRLTEIRRLLMDGKGREAAKIPVEQSFLEGYDGLVWSDPYIPAFDIKINQSPENISNYKRSLNFENGEAKVEWEQNGAKYIRSQFISRADSLMVIKVKAEEPFDISFCFEKRPVKWNEANYVNSRIKETDIYAKDNKLYYHTAFVFPYPGSPGGYDGIGRLINKGGTIVRKGDKLIVRGTDEVMLLVLIDTFNEDDTNSKINIENKLDSINLNYDELLERHTVIHSRLFNRVSFSLTGDSDDKGGFDAEVMMQKARTTFDPAIVQKQFYASRYNILSATGKNPPNLQGIWGIEWKPPWSSDFTHDGNLPVAISSFLCSNMPELMLSYFDYHDSRLNDYRDNARSLYGCRGIQVPSHSSTRGWNVHFDSTWCLTFWNAGAAWAAHFYYDYWLYTHDISFLKDRAYPFMKEAALFFEDFMTIDDHGKYMFNPSYSPENNPANFPSQATINATMDVMVTKELFRNLVEAGKELHEKNSQIRKWNEILEKLPDYEVDSTGALREWLWDGYYENQNHRHISHLYAMYDMIDPEFVDNDELLSGVRKVVDERMKTRRNEEGGIMVFGLVQLAWVVANLGDASLEEEIIKMLSSHYWSNSLATYHDPEGLFNMDLSGGFQTVIIRALLYSEPGLLSIFPAKPPSWHKGSITGILARDQILVKDLNWNNNLINFKIESPKDQTVKIKLPTGYKLVKLIGKQGKIISVDKIRSTAICKLPADKEVQLQFLSD